MKIPVELWELIFSCLALNDMIEVSCVCKDFYGLSRSDSLFMKKLTESTRYLKIDHGLLHVTHCFVILLTILCSEN